MKVSWSRGGATDPRLRKAASGLRRPALTELIRAVNSQCERNKMAYRQGVVAIRADRWWCCSGWRRRRPGRPGWKEFRLRPDRHPRTPWSCRAHGGAFWDTVQHDAGVSHRATKCAGLPHRRACGRCVSSLTHHPTPPPPTPCSRSPSPTSSHPLYMSVS